ncbi:hypothetical protein PV08_01467 [Exophiala spinifera]|uniref:A-kinase anchor protein 7-like phosphoesterase domain-containing protein n=1 Tax=Exophiala spinifera TaxID=91928 RepID=A0A0D2BPL0_9EURO|nr:uncharacterized protein PV08_01467 [Exophiala spinifera]KIW20888.1 hypothetical protein PV08_01467 [Exophiala spinifera]
MYIGRGATLRDKRYKTIIGNLARGVRPSGSTSVATTEPFTGRRKLRLVQSVMANAMASEHDSRSQTLSHPGQRQQATQGKGRHTTTPTRSKRPTHFVCLPLVTESSVPQLSESLAYFRSVTGTPAPVDRGGAQKPAGTGDPKSPSLPESQSGRGDDRLRLIPPAAHRPPGTLHLTLGAMDLSAPEDLQRAVQVLESIDYLDLLAEAGMSFEHSHDAGTSTTQVSTDIKRADGSKGSIGAGDNGSGQDENVDEGSGQGRIHAGSETISKPLKSLAREISPPPITSRTLANDGIAAAQTSTAPTTATVGAETQRQRQQQQQQPLLPTSPSPTRSLTVTLHGLGTFPRPSSSRVFFAHAHDHTGRLLPFGNAVRRRFQDARLVTETRPLVLHATVANLIYVKARPKERGGRGRGRGEAMTVDARDILRFFNDGKAVEDRSAASAFFAEGSPDGDQDNLLPASSPPELASSYIWARDILVDRIRICKMGAEVSEVEGWGMEYKAVAEKVFGS